MNREKIYKQLFGLIESIEGVKETGRRLKFWGDCLEFPCIFLAQGNEAHIKTGRGLPSKWELSPMVYIYVKVETGEIPGPAINDLLDSLTEALKPPEPIDNKQTLGGLVEDCWIDGQVLTDEGALGEYAVAVVPIKIIVSN